MAAYDRFHCTCNQLNADDGPLIMAFGSSHQLRKKQKLGHIWTGIFLQVSRMKRVNIVISITCTLFSITHITWDNMLSWHDNLIPFNCLSFWFKDLKYINVSTFI